MSLKLSVVSGSGKSHGNFYVLSKGLLLVIRFMGVNFYISIRLYFE